MNSNLKGFVYGIATSATFGLIPLFTLPLMAKGMQFDSILFYRFLFASIALVGIMAVKKESMRIDKKDIPVLILLGFFYTASAMFLFWGYNFMSAGIATTLHFTYPIFVTLIMLVFFREKTSWVTLLAIGLARGNETECIGRFYRVAFSRRLRTLHYHSQQIEGTYYDRQETDFLCIHRQYPPVRHQSKYQRRHTTHPRRHVGYQPDTTCHCSDSHLQHYACTGSTQYRRYTHSRTRGNGTCHRCFCRCVTVRRTIHFQSGYRYPSHNHCCHNDHSVKNHTKKTERNP